MTSKQKNWSVFFATLALGLIAAAALLGLAGNTDENVVEALRITARTAFAIFLFVFIARPAHQFFTTPSTAKLLRRRRLLGIAFTGVHTAHLILIFYRIQLSESFTLVASNVLGAFVYLIILAMFVTSFDTTARMLGKRNWKILHTIGLWIIFFAFLQREIRQIVASGDSASQFLVVCAAAALVFRAANAVIRVRQQ